MKKAKQILAVLLAIAMILALGACGNANTSAASSAEAASTEAASTEAASAEAAEAAEESAAAEPAEAASAAEAAAEPAEVSGKVAYDLPIGQDGDTIKVWTGQWFGYLSSYFSSYSDTDFWKQMNEKLGIDFEFTVAADPWTEVSLIVAAGEEYDMLECLGSFYGGGDAKLFQDEYILDLADYLDQTPNYKAMIESDDAYLKNVMTDDGQISCFYKLATDVFPYTGLWIDETAMENAGITELPTTIDDYTETMKAIKSSTGSAPLWIGSTGGMPSSYFGSAYGINVELFDDGDGYDVYVEDGVVKYGPLEDGFKDYLETMNQWWNDGLIYADFPSNATNMGGDEDAIGRGVRITPRELNQASELTSWTDGDTWVALSAPVLNEGDTTHFLATRDTVGSGWYVPATCEQLDLVLTAIDYFYSDEGIILANYGFEGVTMSYDENGDPVLDYDAMYNTPPYDDNQGAARINFLGSSDSISVVYYALTIDGYTDDQKAAIDTWETNADAANVYPANTSFTEEEQDQYNAIAADLSTYVAENLPKFVMGSLNLDSDYDAFVEQVKALGGEDYVALYQAAYDRYAAR